MSLLIILKGKVSIEVNFCEREKFPSQYLHAGSAIHFPFVFVRLCLGVARCSRKTCSTQIYDGNISLQKICMQSSRQTHNFLIKFTASAVETLILHHLLLFYYFYVVIGSRRAHKIR